jgi:hypothetical protein
MVVIGLSFPVVLMSGLSSDVLAQGIEAPFAQGLEHRRLSVEERADLLSYVENSKFELEQAIELVKKDVSQGLSVYCQTVTNVVRKSYASKPRQELLLRIALNQGLVLACGVPVVEVGRSGTNIGSGANGETQGVVIAKAVSIQLVGASPRGLLAGSSNEDLIRKILEDSIELALRYYPVDRQAIESQTLTDLPYAKFGYERLLMGMKWINGVFENSYRAILANQLLEQYLNVLVANENSRKTVFAEEILAVESFLNQFQYQNQMLIDDAGRVRLVRGIARKVLESSRKKLVAQGVLVECRISIMLCHLIS